MAEIDPNRLSALMVSNQKARASVEAFFIDTYDEFIAYVYKHLDKAIATVQRNRHQYSALVHIGERSVVSEDLITTIIVNILGENNLKVSSKVVGGNVDIVVELEGTDYQWLCEAKLDNNVGHIEEGFLQLTTRYASVERDEREGGILIYHRAHGLDFMDKVKEELPNRDELLKYDLQIKPCDLRPDFSFFTESLSPGAGGRHRYRSRFMGVQLIFNPRDKSGRIAKYLKKAKRYLHSLDLDNKKD